MQIFLHYYLAIFAYNKYSSILDSNKKYEKGKTYSEATLKFYM